MPWGVFAYHSILSHYAGAAKSSPPRRPGESADAALERFRAEERQRQHAALMARILDKETNMSTRLERRRRAIRLKWRARLATVGAVLFGLPLVVAALAALYRLAVYMVAG